MSHLQAATRALAGTWSPAQDLGASPSRILTIGDDVDDQGNGVVLWYSAAGLQSRVYDVGGPDLRDLSVPGGSAGQALGFSVNPRDRWSLVSSTSWDFGDGATAQGPQVSHAFAEGVYTVRVTSVDVLGNSSSTTRNISVGPPPPPPPPPPAIKPLLTGATGSITARFKRSAVTGKSSITFAGALNVARRLSIVLHGPMRPAGKSLDASLGALDAGAGNLSRAVTLPKAVAKKLLPGAYELRITGPDVSATWRLTLRAPAEGVVLSKKMSTSRKGLSLSGVTKAKQLWATFKFAAGAPATKKLTVRWFSPVKKKPVGTFPVQSAQPFSYWKNNRGLTKGTWRAVLMAGKTQVSALSIKVG
jgi:PKD repeat protein